ncbi:aspartate kinase [Cytobacillus sp. S13-E01]|uniref:aspartate kinase n=1 Tax=Cytobacillus sp. S13-E01 TaxID=3031326 RepID=UPI0023D88D00|nr:aspartate kinase [Cytobacillus sp. S13-E01]MDF0726711.1 aspartate kinase [Cytobacillus sp. S13-E01]
MGIIVQKFGGTSVGSVERIQNVANRVIDEVKRGNKVVVVVSAMGKTTDELVGLAGQISKNPSKREMDMLLTTGEQVTISLLTLALLEKGYEAVSYTGWQAGIRTEPIHSNARIVDIDTKKVNNSLENGKIVVVAGFQGATLDGSITTLGRGGSDTTAVALAAALKADKCDIYTDVTGVYTTDPRYVKKARKLYSVSYDEMLELANLGAGVLHPRAVEFAKNYLMPLEVRSSLEQENGTIIEEEVSMEKSLVVRGIAFEDQVTRVTVCGLPSGLHTLSMIFTTLAKNGLNVDIIIQSTTNETETSISFSIKTTDLEDTIAVLEKNREELQFTAIEHESGLAKVSIVGSGMISNPGVAAEMFQVLANHEIQVKMVSTSEIKVSTVVDQDNMVKAVEALHEAFNLSVIENEEKSKVNV